MFQSGYGRPALIDATGRVCPLDTATPDLAHLIFRHTECLPLKAIAGIEAPIPVCRHLPTAAGDLDMLLMTASGELVLVAFCGGVEAAAVVAQTLDRAASIFAMNYAELTAAVAAAVGDDVRLYDLVSDCAPSELGFVAAVGDNLARHRATVVAICDDDADIPAEILKSHMEADVTIAIMTMQAFATPGGDLLLFPQALTKTKTVSRIVVKTDERYTPTFSLEGTLLAPNGASRKPEERFFAAMAVLHPDLPRRIGLFLRRLEASDIRPVYGRLLSLEWDTPDGQTVLLAYVTPEGQIWTDVGTTRLDTCDALILAHQYVERLAYDLGLTVNRTGFGEVWTLWDESSPPNIRDLVFRLDCWASALEQLVACLRLRFSAE